MSSSRLWLPAANRVFCCPIQRFKWPMHYRECLRKRAERRCLSSRTATVANPDKPQLKTLTLDNLNPGVVIMKYAVRGPLPMRAAEIEKELKKGAKKPFDQIIRANIGDGQAMGQKPITYLRQVVSLVMYPSFMKSKDLPDDAKRKAESLLSVCSGQSAGSYTESPGIELIRRNVAEYIQKRDGIPSDWKDIILCNGASIGIRCVLKLLRCGKDGKKPGVMVAIPQYPLYSATLAEYDMHLIGYFLDESRNWALEIEELQRVIDEAKSYVYPRALVVINPGNPTGQVLRKENMQAIIKFAHKEKLFLIADEVYQYNIYDKNAGFHSFKKVMMEMGPPYSNMELASFMSCSKGYMGECGIRGGYGEVINLDPDVKTMYLKCISAVLCPSVLGQIALDCVVAPPQPGDPSYELHTKEKTHVLESLAQRAKMVADGFNSIEGFSCNEVQGAMYAFPQFLLPPKAIEKAKKLNLAPCAYYAFQLLENTGVCVVPGSGFGQKEGTYHFRTTILPQTEKLKVMLDKFKNFHKEFLRQHK